MIDTYIDSEKAEQRWTDTETVRENKIDRVGVWKKDGKEEQVRSEERVRVVKKK